MIKLSQKHSEPFVTLDDLKENLRVINNDEDRLIERLAATACQYVQEVSGRKLNRDQYVYSFSSIPFESISLPVFPIISVDNFIYYDTDNAQQSIALENLRIFSDEEACYILPQEGEEWPVVFARDDAVIITFSSGYPSDLLFPENLKQAAILLASHWYENRTAASMQMHEIPHGVDSLINLTKVRWYV